MWEQQMELEGKKQFTYMYIHVYMLIKMQYHNG